MELFFNEYVKSGSFIISAAILGNIFHIVLRKYLHKLAAKTKTDIDDVILGIIVKPLYVFILFLGLYLALKTLTIAQPYTRLMDNIFYIIVVLGVSLIASRIFTFLIDRWLRVQKRFQKTPQVLNRMVKVTIFILAILMILGHFDIEITPLIAAFGLGGLAVGLALQNTLSNFFAGLHIISDQPVRVGDYIKVDNTDIAGYVEDVGWRSTRIKTLPNTIVIIPNNKLAESIIINNSMPDQEIAALIDCGVGYGSNLEKVEKVTIDVATKIQKTVPGAVKTFVPFIRYNAFGDSNINFTVILRVEKFVDKYVVAHEFIKALKERYDREKIEISWPIRKIYYGNEKK